jgi:protein-disulfide isomerase
MNRKILFISVAGFLVLAFVLAKVLFQGQEVVSQDQGALYRTSAPIKGPATAKVTIVEFFDPACGTCRDFFPVTKKLIEQYPGQVRVMLRYAPLHPGSDQVVKMLEAAHYQGKFLPALELLFANQQRWIVNHTSQPMRALALLNSLGMDQEKFTADMRSPAVIQAVQQDVQDGQTLKVRATPEFFVNGRPMPSFGVEQLQKLVKEAVAAAY